jgi:hypothetical protein
LPLFPFSVLWGLSSEVFIRGFISSLPQRAWDKKALLLLLLLFQYTLIRISEQIVTIFSQVLGHTPIPIPVLIPFSDFPEKRTVQYATVFFWFVPCGLGHAGLDSVGT